MKAVMFGFGRWVGKQQWLPVTLREHLAHFAVWWPHRRYVRWNSFQVEITDPEQPADHWTRWPRVDEE